jgi:signal transduction histidine kinase
MKATGVSKSGTGSGPSGNLGLGLYIAERIVNAHRGRIDVESTDEDGTTFTLHLSRHTPTTKVERRKG